MHSQATNDPFLARHVAVCLTLRGLIERMILLGLLGPSDMLAIRDYALNFGADIGGSVPTGPPSFYEAVSDEVRCIWDSLGIPPHIQSTVPG